jgi:hypothetical protein
MEAPGFKLSNLKVWRCAPQGTAVRRMWCTAMTGVKCKVAIVSESAMGIGQAAASVLTRESQLIT